MCQQCLEGCQSYAADITKWCTSRCDQAMSSFGLSCWVNWSMPCMPSVSRKAKHGAVIGRKHEATVLYCIGTKLYKEHVCLRRRMTILTASVRRAAQAMPALQLKRLRLTIAARLMLSQAQLQLQDENFLSDKIHSFRRTATQWQTQELCLRGGTSSYAECLLC